MRTLPLDFCSEITDIVFHGRRRENYDSPTLETRLKAFFNLHVHSELLRQGGKEELRQERKVGGYTL